jgi:hypothetical protein
MTIGNTNMSEPEQPAARGNIPSDPDERRERMVALAKKPRRPNLRLQQQQRQAAVLVAQGKLAHKEIALQIGIKPETLRRWTQSESFRVTVREFSDRIVDGAVLSIQERLSADAPTNITFLKGVRDGDFTDDPKRMTLRLRAGEALFDRQAPKHGAQDSAIKVVIGEQLLGQMVRAMRNDGATVDAEFEQVAHDVEALPAPSEDEHAADE